MTGRAPSATRSVPIVTDEPWTRYRACTPETTHLFFAARHERRITLEAKAVCARCPVKRECLDYAYRLDDQVGVYGGMTAWERRQARYRSVI